MKYSHKLSDAVHILAYIDILPDTDLSSSAIAASVDSNPSLIRRLMSLLVQAGLLKTSPGKIDPKLARSADDISLLDIYLAIEDDPQLLHVDDKTNMQCIVGGNIQATLNQAYRQVQEAAQKQMAAISLQSLIDDILVRDQTK
jgi:DNA-binding IscR family transcriptional regulator